MMQPARNSHLARLEVLEGEWEMAVSIAPGTAMRARSVFTWIENRSFLVQHTDMEPAGADSPPGSPLPTVLIIGLDDTTDTFSVLHADARDVFRVYQMTLDDGVWRIWRDAPGFSQRFTGRFSRDGRTIQCAWEKAVDGADWEHDFDLTYTKLG